MTEIEVAHKDYLKLLHLRSLAIAGFFPPFLWLTNLADSYEVLLVLAGGILSALLFLMERKSEKLFVFFYVFAFMIENLFFWLASYLHFNPALIYLALLSGICMLAGLSETTKKHLLFFATYLVAMCLSLIMYNYALVVPAVMSILWISQNTLKTIDLQRQLLEKNSLSAQSSLMMDSYRYLAHHINNALTVIKGHCELIRWKAQSTNDAQLIKSTSRILASCQRMEKIVQVFKTLNSGELKNIPSENDIQNLIKEKDKENENSNAHR